MTQITVTTSEYTGERHRLREMINEQHELELEMRELQKKMNHLNEEIHKLLRKHEPTCSSCGKHKLQESMHIASEEDVRDFDDCDCDDSWVSGPVVGKYYCGCW
jgi:regulator of replication initiation timing